MAEGYGVRLIWVFRDEFTGKRSIWVNATDEFMRNSNKILVGLTTLAVVIGLGILFNGRQGARRSSPAGPDSVAMQSTNRPPVHAQRPTVVVNTPKEPEQSGPPQSPQEKA